MYDTVVFKREGLVGMGITDPRFATIRAIAKDNGVVNEYVCLELAKLLGVPVPPGLIARDKDGKWYYVSVQVGIHQPGVAEDAARVDDIDSITHPRAFAQARKIDAFDYLVGNNDRHGYNALWTGPDSIAAIDFGYAFGSRRLRAGRLSGHGREAHNACLEIIKTWQSQSLLEACKAVFDNIVDDFAGCPSEQSSVKFLKAGFVRRLTEDIEDELTTL